MASSRYFVAVEYANTYTKDDHLKVKVQKVPVYWHVMDTFYQGPRSFLFSTQEVQMAEYVCDKLNSTYTEYLREKIQMN